MNSINPYEELTETWLKGNLHSHTTPASPCGTVEIEKVLSLYERSGYDFISISDHLNYTKVSLPTSLLCIPGVEWNSRTPDEAVNQLTYYNHLGIYSNQHELLTQAIQLKEIDEVLEFLKNKDALVIFNHPDWLIPEHYNLSKLLNFYDTNNGMEIFNAVIDSHPGKADSTEKWDRILTEKGPLLGFVSDDSHRIEDINKAWLMVNVKEKSVESILQSLRAGCFYGSTGVQIQKIGRKGDLVYCHSHSSVLIEAIGIDSRILASAKGYLEVSFKDNNSSFIRFECSGQGKAKAWSQAFFKE